MSTYIHNAPQGTPQARVLFLHGAGGPADTPWMDQVATALSDMNLSVYRAEFAYMAPRRHGGSKRPPPKAETLLGEVGDMIAQLPESELPLWLAGKSMGGRIATLWVAQQEMPMALPVPERTLVLGYPFHPPGKPDRLRVAHLPNVVCSTHILQGTRDPLGNVDEVTALDLGLRVKLTWVEDGDHDLRPRGLKKAEVAPALVNSINQWFAAI